jgi:predicted enzyme related to lactoylglutathione lyase
MVTPEPDRAAKFYRDLCDWTLSQANSMGYRELASGESHGADGGVWPAPAGQPAFVQLFIEVDDIDATIARATGLGAKVVIPKSMLPDGDTMAVLLDPVGLSFGLCRLGRKNSA